MGAKKSTTAKKANEEITPPAQAIQNLLQEFLANVNQHVAENQEKAKEVQQILSSNISDYQVEFQRLKEEEYRRMIGDVQEAFGQEKSQEKITVAETKFKANLEEKKDFLTKGIEESNQKYAKQLENIAADNKKAYEAAYQEFIKGLKKEINAINLKDFNAETLASVGQMLLHASRYAVSPE